eukprot:TRINITY_DN770_c1_g1_i3.p1 TRINITY_DN770_c1_g1~~TRINITY_DN770_c1_g1_i3.p1  ORF type:complete len:464 (+),score=106.09 TRINITY_DN770_c1_g1_i3:176-1393(+)
MNGILDSIPLTGYSQIVNQDSSWKAHFLRSLSALLFGSSFNVLLVFVPTAYIAVWLNMSDGVIFFCSLLALAPLAERLSFITEQLAMSSNPTVGALLNATFSNAPELIIVIMALKSKLVRVIQLSLLGSIIGNMLLCLGSAFLASGIAYPNATFNAQAVQVESAALLVALFGILFPGLLDFFQVEIAHRESQMRLSLISAFVMLIAYTAFIIFQLITHKEIFGEEDDGDSEDEEVILGFWSSTFWLAIVTVLISSLSDYLVNSVESTAKECGVPLAGLVVVLLPVVNNVAEHASAIIFGYRNKLDLALGIAVGSSIQLSMFLIPLAVVAGWLVGTPMSLNFYPFETASLAITIIATSLILHDGRANWLKGLFLILMYVMVASAYFNMEEKGSSAPSSLVSPLKEL